MSITSNNFQSTAYAQYSPNGQSQAYAQAQPQSYAQPPLFLGNGFNMPVYAAPVTPSYASVLPFYGAIPQQQPTYPMAQPLPVYSQFVVPQQQSVMLPQQPVMFAYPMQQQMAAPQQPQWVNNFALQNQYANQAVTNVQQFIPAGIGEILGLSNVFGQAYGCGTNLLSSDPGVSRAVELLTGIPGGIPGFSKYGTNVPTFPLSRRWDGMFIGVPQSMPR